MFRAAWRYESDYGRVYLELEPQYSNHGIHILWGVTYLDFIQENTVEVVTPEFFINFKQASRAFQWRCEKPTNHPRPSNLMDIDRVLRPEYAPDNSNSKVTR